MTVVQSVPVRSEGGQRLRLQATDIIIVYDMIPNPVRHQKRSSARA